MTIKHELFCTKVVGIKIDKNLTQFFSQNTTKIKLNYLYKQLLVGFNYKFSHTFNLFSTATCLLISDDVVKDETQNLNN